MNKATPFSEMKNSLEQRWKQEWSQEVPLLPVLRAFNASLGAVEALMSKTAAMRGAGKFSAQGLKDEIRQTAQTSTVPILRRSGAVIDRTRAELAGRRAALAMPAPDPNNAAQAIVRSEMRTWLRSLPQTQTVQVLLGDKVDDRMLQAAFEAPPVMSGLTDDMRAMVQARTLERKYGQELARLDRLGEAVDVAGSALGVALYQLRQEAQFASHEDRAFDLWMGEATTAAEAMEAVKSVEDVLSETQEEVDEIFARAFPQIYRDHPINRAAPRQEL